MKTYRGVLCVLLALAMTVSFCACGRDGEEGADESAVPTGMGGGESAFPTQTGGDVPGENSGPDETGGTTTLLDLTGSGPDCVVLSREEYENRPRGIQAGTVLDYCAWEVAYSFIPWAERSDEWLWGNIYEGLLYMYMNDPEDIRGCIAERWTHSEDCLTWTFQIRDGVRFADGTVCDAEAIVKSWDRIYGRAVTDCDMESWEATGPLELVVRLSAPCAWFEANLCRTPLYVLSPTALAIYGLEDKRAGVGTGPYSIDSWRGSSADFIESGDYGCLVLKANPDYYLEEKMPCIETVNIHYLRKQERIMEALLAGEIDGAVFDDVDIYDTLLESGYSGRLGVCLGGVDALWFNAGLEVPLGLIEVREALCRFLDFDAVNGDIYKGLGGVSDSIWAKGSSVYVPTDQFYYDPDEGNDLLSSVGLTASDIRLNASYIVDMFYDRDDEDSIYRGVERALRGVGVAVDFSVIDVAPGFSPMFSGKWTLQIGGFAYDNVYPFAPWLYIMGDCDIVAPWWTSIFDKERYGEMETAYDAMKKAVTWDEMTARCKQLTACVQDGFGAVGGLQKPVFIGLGKEFKNGVYFSCNCLESWFPQLYYLYT